MAEHGLPGPPMAPNGFFGVALIRALERLGYKQGNNLAFEHRGADFHPDLAELGQ